MEEEIYHQSGPIKMEFLSQARDPYQMQANFAIPNQFDQQNINGINNVGAINYNQILQNKSNFSIQNGNNQRNSQQDGSIKQSYSLQDDLMHYLCIEGQKKQQNSGQSIDSKYLNLMKQELMKRSENMMILNNPNLEELNAQGMTPMQFAAEQQQFQQMNAAFADQSKINYYKKMQEISQNKEQQMNKLQTDFLNNQNLWDEECRNKEDKPSLNDYQLLQQQQQQNIKQQTNLLCNSLQYFNSTIEDIRRDNEVVGAAAAGSSFQQQNQYFTATSKKEEETQSVAPTIDKSRSDTNLSSATFATKSNYQNEEMKLQNQLSFQNINGANGGNGMDEEQLYTTNLNAQEQELVDKPNSSLQQEQEYDQNTHKINKKQYKRKQNDDDIEDSQIQEEEVQGPEQQLKEGEDEDNQLGSLSFEEFAFSENAFKLDEQKEENRLIVKYILHPTLKPVEAFLINGEIIVSFDLFYQKKNQEHDKVSLWNMFRPINSIQVKNTIVEVNMHKSQNTITNFQPLIQRLMSMPDQQAYASAQMLQQHYISLQHEQQIKQQVFDVYGQHIAQLQWQFEENFHKSKQMAYDMMDQLPEDAFFLYSIRRTDPISLDSIFCALGYSKGLIRLIAGNEQIYQQFCFRSGLAEIFNAQSRLQILLMNLLFSNKVQITITTLDDITIPIEMRVHYQKLMQTEILPGVYKEDYMKIYQILIDQKYLDEIFQIRGFSDDESGKPNCGPRIIQPDYTYQMQSHRFIERFYSETLKEKKNAIKKASELDQKNFSAEFQRIFGKQNEGQNFLHNVFNTTIKQNNNHNSMQSPETSSQNIPLSQSPSHPNTNQSNMNQQNQQKISTNNALNQSSEIRQKQESIGSCSLGQSIQSSFSSSNNKSQKSSSSSSSSRGANKKQQQNNYIKTEELRSRNSSSHTSNQQQSDEVNPPSQIHS